MGFIDLDVGCVSFSLFKHAHDVSIVTLGLDHADECRASKESVVGRTAGCWPLGNGEVAAFGWSSAFAVPDGLGVGFPTCV